MRWDRFFDGFESLWDAENDNAELDERRELIRADRATTSFLDVIAQRGSTAPLTLWTVDSPRVVHLRRIGATWIDGDECGNGARIIFPFAVISRIETAPRCTCQTFPVKRFAHVTFGAVLRELERNYSTVTVSIPHGGVRGTIRAVWKDAIEVGSGSSSTLVTLATIDRIIVDRP